MKKKLKNSEMVQMVNGLTPILSQRNRIGYAAARNYRVLSDALTEYDRFRSELIEKYGKPDRTEDGVELPSVSIKMNSPNFKAFCDELAPFNEIEHEVELMTLKYEDTIGVLSGEEIVGITWMLED